MRRGRYLLFAGDFYYPCGGCGDLVTVFEELGDAVREATAVDRVHPESKAVIPRYAWWHVLDTDLWEIVERSKEGPFIKGSIDMDTATITCELRRGT